MGTRMKKNDLTNEAMHGWLGVPEQYLATSPAWYAYKLGEYLARTGSMAPCDVRMGRGYQIHANNMLFAFDAKNAITMVDGNNLGMKAPMTKVEAQHIMRVLNQSDGQATLNGLAIKLGAATALSDANTVRARMRCLADAALSAAEPETSEREAAAEDEQERSGHGR
jgi:hypothetical protein